MPAILNNSKFQVLILGIFFFIYFFIVASQTLDSDFGFHIRLGQLLLTKGIPTTDPFSYSMPSYPFIDHEWLTDISIFLGYPLFGVTGLTIIFVLLAMASFCIQYFTANSKWTILPLVLAMGAVVNYLGIRYQVLSWLLFSVLLVFIVKEQLWQRFRFLLPVLIIIWVNVHGSFPLGVAAVFLAVLARAIQQQKILSSDWLVSFLCLLATGINPYGYRIWWEIWMQMSDSTLHFAIGEWLPAFFVFNLDYLILVVLSLMLVIRYWRKYSKVELFLYFFLLFLGIDSNRHIPFWLLFMIPFGAKGLAYFHKEAAEITLGAKRFMQAYAMIAVWIVIVLVYQFFQAALNHFYSQNITYPDASIRFLQEHPSSGNYFSDYVLGGYLDWKLPEKKIFIDGRMPSWRRNSAPPGESLNAFSDYNKILSGDSRLPQELKTYHIDTLLLMEDHNGRLVDFFDKLTPQLSDNKSHRLEKELILLGFKIVYRDDQYTIYRKE